MKWLAPVACLFGLMAVALGAFGAHALKDWFSQHPDHGDWYQTAAHYHLIHALVALFAARIGAKRSCLAMFAGIALFSGSLYIMALTGVKAWGAVTPFGGVSFMLGWIGLAVATVKGHRGSDSTGGVE